MEVTVSALAIILSMILSVALGMLWYGPLFGKLWMLETGISAPEGAPDFTVMLVPIGASLIGAALMTYVLTHVIAFGNTVMGTDTVGSALMGSLWCWLGFVVPVTLNNFWEGRSVKLIAIYAGYWLTLMLIVGALIATL